MKALILNSGVGRRMGALTADHPKCMTDISARETILSRQLRQLANAGISEAVITTGAFDKALMEYCEGLGTGMRLRFVKNERYAETNYIYSIYLAREYLDDEIIFMHGDLVFEDEVLCRILRSPGSAMTVSSTAPLPEKDFKAVVRDGRIVKVGIEFFDHALSAQPLYHLRRTGGSGWSG